MKNKEDSSNSKQCGLELYTDEPDDYENELYGRRDSKTGLIAMHELDDEFTLFLKGKSKWVTL